MSDPDGVVTTAVEGHRIDLVDHLVDPGTAVAEAVELGHQISAGAPLALAATKAILNAGFWRAR